MPWIDQREPADAHVGSGNGSPVGHPRCVVQFGIAGFRTPNVTEQAYWTGLECVHGPLEGSGALKRARVKAAKNCTPIARRERDFKDSTIIWLVRTGREPTVRSSLPRLVRDERCEQPAVLKRGTTTPDADAARPTSP